MVLVGHKDMNPFDGSSRAFIESLYRILCPHLIWPLLSVMLTIAHIGSFQKSRAPDIDPKLQHPF